MSMKEKYGACTRGRYQVGCALSLLAWYGRWGVCFSMLLLLAFTNRLAQYRYTNSRVARWLRSPYIKQVSLLTPLNRFKVNR